MATKAEVQEMADKCGVHVSTMYNRISKGWAGDRLMQPRNTPRQAAQKSPWSNFNPKRGATPNHRRK